MANIVINAGITKSKKDMAAGVAICVRGTESVGFIDLRRITYKDKTRHIAGLKYDKAKRTFFLTAPKKADDINLGIFISTYDVELVDGKVLAREEISDIYEVSSVGEKYHRGGYNDVLEEAEAKGEKNPEIFPFKVNVKILIISGKKKAVVRNSKGFVFTCDFASGQWYVLRPGTRLPEIYKMEDYDLKIAGIFKEQLPFPAVDRKLWDKSSTIEFDKFDMTKHIMETV